MSALNGSVGRGGANNMPDTRLIQRLLNDARGLASLPLLAVDGLVGPKTIAAIEQFQKSRQLTTDGRVDVGGKTLQRLMSDHFANLTAQSRGRALHLRRVPPLPAGLFTSAMDAYWQALKKN